MRQLRLLQWGCVAVAIAVIAVDHAPVAGIVGFTAGAYFVLIEKLLRRAESEDNDE